MGEFDVEEAVSTHASGTSNSTSQSSDRPSHKSSYISDITCGSLYSFQSKHNILLFDNNNKQKTAL